MPRKVDGSDIGHALVFPICSPIVNAIRLQSTTNAAARPLAGQTTYPGIATLAMVRRKRRWAAIEGDEVGSFSGAARGLEP